jgi:hypothetical protein
MNEQVENIFADVLLLCFEMKLVGGEIFARQLLMVANLAQMQQKNGAAHSKILTRKRKSLKIISNF